MRHSRDPAPSEASVCDRSRASHNRPSDAESAGVLRPVASGVGARWPGVGSRSGNAPGRAPRARTPREASISPCQPASLPSATSMQSVRSRSPASASRRVADGGLRLERGRTYGRRESLTRRHSRSIRDWVSGFKWCPLSPIFDPVGRRAAVVAAAAGQPFLQHTPPHRRKPARQYAFAGAAGGALDLGRRAGRDLRAVVVAAPAVVGVRVEVRAAVGAAGLRVQARVAAGEAVPARAQRDAAVSGQRGGIKAAALAGAAPAAVAAARVIGRGAHAVATAARLEPAARASARRAVALVPFVSVQNLQPAGVVQRSSPPGQPPVMAGGIGREGSVAARRGQATPAAAHLTGRAGGLSTRRS